MSYTVFGSGILTADGTEQFLPDANGINIPGMFALIVSRANQAAGDEIEQRIYSEILSGDTALGIYEQSYVGAPLTDQTVTMSLWVPNNLSENNALKMSIKQTSGTNRTYKWKIVQWDDGANVTKILGTASQGAAGYVGTDQNKITNPTATVDLSGTTVKNVDNAIANVTLVATTTNLTNAPTSGDFTATMKTSLNASTPTSVTTVTGNVNGNVVGSVGSVLGNVIGSIGSLAAQAKTDVAGAVLNAVAASYNVAGSIGALINLISSIDVSGIAASVWNYLVSSAGTDITKMGGYISVYLAAIRAKTDTIGSATLVVVSPVTAAGNLELVQGDSYLAADGRSFQFTYTGQPTFIGAAALLRFTPLGSNATYNIGTESVKVYYLTGTILSATEVQFEMTSDQSARLPVVNSNGGNSARFEVQITLADGSVITPTPLNLGKVSISPQAAP